MKSVYMLAMAALVLSSPVVAQTVLLDDMETLRPNGAGSTVWLPSYNATQVGSIETNDGNKRLKVYVGMDGVGGITGETVGLNVLFWPLQNDRFPHPSGYTKAYIKSGTWSPTINRMEFWMKCDMTHTMNEIYQSMNIGTYIKSPVNGAYNQGTHYYHFFHSNIYPNRWIKMEMNSSPTHLLGTNAGLNPPTDPEWVSPTTGAPVHYFDGLTSWYMTIGTDYGRPYSCWFDDFRMFTETDEPDAKVKSISVTYNGSAYEVAWESVKNTAMDFEIRYSTTSMKASGFTSGTLGGTKRKEDNGGYAGVRWVSAAMPENPAGLYFAIKPAGETKFAEIHFPKTPGSSAPATSPCDIDGNGRVDSADVSSANKAALGLAACTADLDKNGQCNVVDSQRVINAAIGGTCRSN